MNTRSKGRAASTKSNATKTHKPLGNEGLKRIAKAQPSGSRRSRAWARLGFIEDKDKKASSSDGRESEIEPATIQEGLCRFCKFRPLDYDNDNNGRDDNRPQSLLLKEAETVGLLKKFMKEWGNLGTQDKDFEEEKYCGPCGQLMEDVVDVINRRKGAEGNPEGGGGDKGARTTTRIRVPLTQKGPIDEEREVLSKILPFLDTKSFLACRLVNRLWNEEVLKAYPTRVGVSVNVGTYVRQRDLVEENDPLEQGPPPPGSPLLKRVSAYTNDSNALLKFFENGDGRETEVLSLHRHQYLQAFEQEDQEVARLSLGEALFEILKNNWAPNLRELKMTNCDLRDCSYTYEDADFSQSLENLKVMTVSTNCWKEKDLLGRRFPFFLKSILRAAPNLERLGIQEPYLPDLTAMRKMQTLKSLHLGFNSKSPNKPAFIYELEFVLLQVSVSCLHLEELRLSLPSQERMDRFPKFPQLKKFDWAVNGLSLIEGDLLLFLNEKMPSLTKLTLSANGDSNETFVNSILYGLRRSNGDEHRVLEALSLSVSLGCVCCLNDLGAKLPSLKGLKVDTRPISHAQKMMSEETVLDSLAELGVVLAKEFPSIPASILFDAEIDGEAVVKRFSEKRGPQNPSGTSSIMKISPFSSTINKEVRLIPEKKTPQTSRTTEMEVTAPPAEHPVDEVLEEPETASPILRSPEDRRRRVLKSWKDFDNPEAFLKFFETGEGRGTEKLSFCLGHDQEPSNWGNALTQTLKNNWAPNLRQLVVFVIHFDLRECNEFYEDVDLSKGLENLKLLSIVFWEEENLLGQGFPFFVKGLLGGAKNLVRLKLRGFLPEDSAIEEMKDLKSLDLNLEQCSPTLTHGQELERVLLQVSTNCHHLEELTLRLDSEEMLTRFPCFPKLEQFRLAVKDSLHFIEGDLIRFIKEKMPALRSLTALGITSEVFRALHSSKEKHEGLEFLSILAPEDFRLLEGFKAKFPSLTGFLVTVSTSGLESNWAKNGGRSSEDCLAELVVVVANEFPSIPATIAFHNCIVGETVKETFLEKMGPQYKGTFLIGNYSPGMYCRLIPGNVISKIDDEINVEQ